MTKTTNKKKCLFNLNEFYTNLASLVTKKKPFAEAAASKVEELKGWPDDLQSRIDKHPDVMSYLDKANDILQSPEKLKELKKRIEDEKKLAARRGRFYETTPESEDDLQLVRLIWDIATNDNTQQSEDPLLTAAVSNFNEVFTPSSDDGAKGFDFGGGDMGGGGAGGSYDNNSGNSSSNDNNTSNNDYTPTPSYTSNNDSFSDNNSWGNNDAGSSYSSGGSSWSDSGSSYDSGSSSSYDSGSSGGGDWFKPNSQIKPAIYKKRLTL